MREGESNTAVIVRNDGFHCKLSEMPGYHGMPAGWQFDRRRSSHPGPHAYMILHVGVAKRAEINREHADLVRGICALSSHLLPR